MALQVDIYSDVICPWCFVGKRRLGRAVAGLDERHAVRVTWHPFQLNPGMPPEGMDRKAYRSAKYGSWGRSRAMDAQVAAVGATEGIPFAHDRIARTPNTLDAHRLIWFAGRRGRQDAIVEALFRGYFIEGRDLGDRRTLVAITGEAGLDPAAVGRFLDSDEGTAEIRTEEEIARAAGITGVPLFVINGRHTISGAQRAELLLAALERVLELDAAAQPLGETDGASCALDGSCTS
jgi:predicted DsbA family dithiol-disulfide isomerase